MDRRHAMADDAQGADVGQGSWRGRLDRLLGGKDAIPLSAPVAAPLVSDPLAGSGYRAIREIGRGGMAVVLEAKHIALGKLVVVKLLLAQLADRRDMGARLR